MLAFVEPGLRRPDAALRDRRLVAPDRRDRRAKADARERPRIPPTLPPVDPMPSDAILDPWCDVFLDDGERILFGYAIQHPLTGGLSWLRSTPIRKLDVGTGTARTASGRRYLLRRRILEGDIPSEGEEAWLAYELLLGDEASDPDAVPPISANPGRDAEWVAAQKMARHLGVPAPSRSPREVEAFVRRHLAAYRDVLARRD